MDKNMQIFLPVSVYHFTLPNKCLKMLYKGMNSKNKQTKEILAKRNALI